MDEQNLQPPIDAVEPARVRAMVGALRTRTRIEVVDDPAALDVAGRASVPGSQMADPYRLPRELSRGSSRNFSLHSEFGDFLVRPFNFHLLKLPYTIAGKCPLRVRRHFSDPLAQHVHLHIKIAGSQRRPHAMILDQLHSLKLNARLNCRLILMN